MTIWLSWQNRLNANTSVAGVYECRGDPRSGSKVREALDQEIGKPGENCG